MTEALAPAGQQSPAEAHPRRGEAQVPQRRERARVLMYFMLARLGVTTLLLAASLLADLTGVSASALPTTFVFGLIILTYALTVLWAVLLQRGARPRRLAALQLACDVAATTVLVHADGGAESGFFVLYLLAAIGGAMTLSRTGTWVTLSSVALLYFGVAVGDRLGLLAAWPAAGTLPIGPLRGIAPQLGTNLVLLVATALLSRRLADEIERGDERIAAQGVRLKDLATLHGDVVRSLSSGLLTIAADGTVLTLNPTGAEILGRVLPAGRPLSESLPQLARVLEESADGSRRRMEVTVPLPGGEQRILGCSVSPLVAASGGAIGRIVNFQDLSDLRRMQERVERSERLAAIGRLAAGIAHEIRNPLAAISGSLELLRGSVQPDPESRELLEIVTREAERLNRLITDLLHFARPRTPEKTPLDLGATLGEILRMAENDPRLNPVPNRFRLDLPGAVWVEADPGQLRQVVLNLLMNAADATPGGEPIEVSAATDEDAVRIIVRDRGPGIPAAVRERLFEPFFTTKKGGTGLGLATVHRIIEEHHGSIEMTDAPGGGTVCTLRLPRARAIQATA